MRIAVISDIHGNLAALDEVLADIKRRGCDATVNLGDCCAGPLWPRETFERLEALGLPTVRGNHDRHAGDPPASWGVALQSDPFTLGPFACLHEPADSATPATSDAGAPIAIELSGHLHPAFRLTTSRESVALPCFWRHHRGVVLPSFGSFTGSSPVPLDIGESAIVVAGQHLHHLMRRG